MHVAVYPGLPRAVITRQALTQAASLTDTLRSHARVARKYSVLNRLNQPDPGTSISYLEQVELPYSDDLGHSNFSRVFLLRVN